MAQEGDADKNHNQSFGALWGQEYRRRREPPDPFKPVSAAIDHDGAGPRLDQQRAVHAVCAAANLGVAAGADKEELHAKRLHASEAKTKLAGRVPLESATKRRAFTVELLEQPTAILPGGPLRPHAPDLQWHQPQAL